MQFVEMPKYPLEEKQDPWSPRSVLSPELLPAFDLSSIITILKILRSVTR